MTQSPLKVLRSTKQINLFQIFLIIVILTSLILIQSFTHKSCKLSVLRRKSLSKTMSNSGATIGTTSIKSATEMIENKREYVDMLNDSMKLNVTQDSLMSTEKVLQLSHYTVKKPAKIIFILAKTHSLSCLLANRVIIHRGYFEIQSLRLLPLRAPSPLSTKSVV